MAKNLIVHLVDDDFIMYKCRKSRLKSVRMCTAVKAADSAGLRVKISIFNLNYLLYFLKSLILTVFIILISILRQIKNCESEG